MKRASDLFLRSVAALFYFAAAAKFLTLALSPEHFGGMDPVFPLLTVRFMMVTAAIFESALATVILATSSSRLALGLTAWWSTLLALYRIVLILQQSGDCPCLGMISTLFSVTGASGRRASEFLLVYLCIGSYGLLIAESLKRTASDQVLAFLGKRSEERSCPQK